MRWAMMLDKWTNGPYNRTTEQDKCNEYQPLKAVVKKKGISEMSKANLMFSNLQWFIEEQILQIVPFFYSYFFLKIILCFCFRRGSVSLLSATGEVYYPWALSTWQSVSIINSQSHYCVRLACKYKVSITTITITITTTITITIACILSSKLLYSHLQL